MSVFVLGVRIDGYSKKQSIEKMGEFLRNGKQHLVTTPNPEMLVLAQKNAYFQDVLNKSDLNLCDGRGVEWAAKGQVHRFPGVDMMDALCGLAEKQQKRVYLLGSLHASVLEACKIALEKKYPNLHIVGMDTGVRLSFSSDSHLDYDDAEHDTMIDRIISASPDILFVAFGHGKQELWLFEQLPHLPSVKIGMGVGGAFDFISGTVSRAPAWMRQIGLEWLYRLIRQPWRIGRIWNAVVVFGWLIVKEKFHNGKKNI